MDGEDPEATGLEGNGIILSFIMFLTTVACKSIAHDYATTHVDSVCIVPPSFDLDTLDSLCTLTVDRSQYLHEKEMRFQPQRKIILH
jgi:hypothetical protein